MNQRKNRDLGVRTLINGLSALLIAFFIFLAQYREWRWLFAAAVSAVAAIAVWEYDQLVKRKGVRPGVTLSILSVIFYIFSIFVKTQGPYAVANSFLSHTPELVLGAAFLSCFVYFAILKLPPIIHIATTFFGIVYIAVPLSLFVKIIYFFSYDKLDEQAFAGIWWVVYLIAVTKSSDIGGYFVGSSFGKRKLALKLSPKKTLEGALGGLLGSILMSLGICFLGKTYGEVFSQFSYLKSIFLGTLIGIIGQIGDLAESFLKRDASVKDSNSIPGVGGILDMTDSLLFAAPVVYLSLGIIYT